MKRRSRALVAASVVLTAGVLSACGPRQPWQSELVSANADGTGSGSGPSNGGVFSPDGRKVAFVTTADDLGPTDTNSEPDLYLRNLVSGTTTLLSTNAAGTDSGDGASYAGAFSPDGTKFVFSSAAADLGPTDSNGEPDLYVRDLVSGTTTLLSTNAAGTDSGDGASNGGVFSPDGTKFVFSSAAADLGPTDSNGEPDLYVRDLVSGTTSLVSVNAAGTDAGSDGGFDPHFGADGTKVVFTSTSNDLGPPDSTTSGGSTGDGHDVYVRDLASGTTSLVSVNAAGTDSGNNSSYAPEVTPNGTKVAFISYADNLGPTDTNGEPDVYVRDLASGTTSLVSVNAAGTNGGDQHSASGGHQLDPDGTKVAFSSSASDLVPTDTNGQQDVFVRDLATGTTTLVSANAAGTGSGNDSSYVNGFSPDGTTLAFASNASDLGPTDTDINGEQDLFVRDLATGTTTLVSADVAGTASGNGRLTFFGSFSPDGRRITFATDASNLGPADQDRPGLLLEDFDVYVATLRGADLSISGDATPDPVEPRGTLTYRFDVANDGPDPAEATSVAVLLPEGITFADAAVTQGECDAPAEESPRLVVCQLGDLGVDDRGEVTVRASVDAPAGTELTALAAISPEPTADPVHSNNTTQITATVVGG